MLTRQLIRRFGARAEAQTLGLFGVRNLINPSDFDSLTDRAIHRCDQLRYSLTLTYTHSLTHSLTTKGSNCFLVTLSNEPRPGVRAVDSSGPCVQRGLQRHRRRAVMHECAYERVVSGSCGCVVW